jgi:hypothetical protein
LILITPIPSNKKNDAKRDTRRPYRDEEQNNDDSYWEEQPEDTFHCLSLPNLMEKRCLTALSCLSWLRKVDIDGYYRHFTLNNVAYCTRPDQGEVLVFFQSPGVFPGRRRGSVPHRLSQLSPSYNKHSKSRRTVRPARS